jgi:DNA-binding NarL/FixJ family response regulator
MRIILADHHAQPLCALKLSLKEHPELELVGESLDGSCLLHLAGKHGVDLILVDSDLPGMNIADLIYRLHACVPRPIVMVMSSETEKSRMLLNAGADAYVSKTGGPDWLIEKLGIYSQHFSMQEDDKRDICT